MAITRETFIKINNIRKEAIKISTQSFEVTTFKQNIVNEIDNYAKMDVTLGHKLKLFKELRPNKLPNLKPIEIDDPYRDTKKLLRSKLRTQDTKEREKIVLCETILDTLNTVKNFEDAKKLIEQISAISYTEKNKGRVNDRLTTILSGIETSLSMQERIKNLQMLEQNLDKIIDHFCRSLDYYTLLTPSYTEFYKKLKTIFDSFETEQTDNLLSPEDYYRELETLMKEADIPESYHWEIYQAIMDNNHKELLNISKQYAQPDAEQQILELILTDIKTKLGIDANPKDPLASLNSIHVKKEEPELDDNNFGIYSSPK